jgi:methionyl-tRNA formyltransferase
VATVIDAKNFFIQCRNGIIKPLIIQREGKKPMSVKDFLNGYRIEVGDKIKSV